MNKTDIIQKVGKKGQLPPVRVQDVEQVACPKVSTKEMSINHSLLNTQGRTVCEFCRVTWAKLDQQVREAAARSAAERARR